MDLFTLCASIALDKTEYERGLDDASTKTHSFGEKLKTGLATAAKVGAGAITAASAAVGALTKQSLDGYAEYEQLVGGVETLFGASADAVVKNAERAYKTAGLSANEYMETVTSFSASLLQSLDGDTYEAMESADKAITDMADNANKMGTAMDSIQNAYQGFAKQNFTMLDNLKLGYGGTKEEMQRLLADAEKLSGIKYDISSYADIVDAIHVVQTEMGITGTTAAEAASTIQGSVSAAKSAWSNLVAGLGNENADLDQLVRNLVTSVETAAGNILPRVTQILSGMGTAITQIAPVIAAEVPNLITSILPSMVSGGAQLLTGLISGLISALPGLISAAPEIVTSVATAVSDNLPTIQAAGGELLDMMTTGILDGIPVMLNMLPDVFINLYNFLAENLPGVIEKGFDILMSLVDGIIGAIPGMVAKLPEVIQAMMNYLMSVFPVILKKGGELLGQLIMGILGAIPEIAVQLPNVISAIVDALEAGWGLIKDAGKYLLEGLWAGISDKVEWLKGKVGGVVDTIKGWFTGPEGFDEHSPSKWAISVADFMMQGLSIGMENGKGNVMETVEDIIGEVKDRFNGLTDVLGLKQDVGNLEYDLWERTEGKTASEAEKLEKQLELLNGQQTAQSGIVEAAASAYELILGQYGENSKESLSYQKTLLQELSTYQDLIDKIGEVTTAKERLYATETATVNFSGSAIAKATEASINAVTSVSNTQDFTLNATLVAPDGTQFANYYLPSFIKQAAANGTPIAGQQYA